MNHHCGAFIVALGLAGITWLGLSLAAHDVAAAAPYGAYLPSVGCAGCVRRALQPIATPRPNPSAYAVREIELVNEARAAVGCPPVVANDALMRGAQAWSETMAREGFAGHSGAGYYERFGYPHSTRVENIGSGEWPEDIFERWMASTLHRRNIEWCILPSDPSYDPTTTYDIGVGYAWPGYWTLTISDHVL